MSASSVSVLIPTYNRSQMLAECLQSVLQQSRPPSQVIVIDDGSTDDTAERVSKFGSSVTYVRQQNAGKPRALNRALPLVVGDLVWIFDDDDVALPTSIERRLRALEENPEAGMVVSNHVWGESGPEARITTTGSHSWPRVSAADFLLRLMHGCFTTLQGALVRTTCYREVGPFREELVTSEDYEMLVRVARQYPTVLLDEPTFIFRRHSGTRGPAGLRYAAQDRQKVFARFDRVLGQRIREDVPLGDFLAPPVRTELSPGQERMALVARMSVMASKGLYSEMLDDALAYAGLVDQGAGGGVITSEERDLIIGAAQEPYFVLGLLEERNNFVTAASRLRSSRTGREMLRWFARGLFGVARWPSSGVLERRTALTVATLLIVESFI